MLVVIDSERHNFINRLIDLPNVPKNQSIIVQYNTFYYNIRESEFYSCVNLLGKNITHYKCMLNWKEELQSISNNGENYSTQIYNYINK